METTISMPAYYQVKKLNGMEDLKECFPNGQADDLNWCFIGLSGVHGSYMKLDDLNPGYRNEEGDYQQITVIVFRPRTVVALYGEVKVKSKKDEEFLRGLAESTVDRVRATQRRNLSQGGQE